MKRSCAKVKQLRLAITKRDVVRKKKSIRLYSKQKKNSREDFMQVQVSSSLSLSHHRFYTRIINFIIRSLKCTSETFRNSRRERFSDLAPSTFSTRSFCCHNKARSKSHQSSRRKYWILMKRNEASRKMKEGCYKNQPSRKKAWKSHFLPVFPSKKNLFVSTDTIEKRVFPARIRTSLCQSSLMAGFYVQ